MRWAPVLATAARRSIWPAPRRADLAATAARATAPLTRWTMRDCPRLRSTPTASPGSSRCPNLLVAALPTPSASEWVLPIRLRGEYPRLERSVRDVACSRDVRTAPAFRRCRMGTTRAAAQPRSPLATRRPSPSRTILPHQAMAPRQTTRAQQHQQHQSSRTASRSSASRIRPPLRRTWLSRPP